MASSERPSDKNDIYYRAARFAGEADAGRTYFKAQDLLLHGPTCDLSAYRLQLDQIWHVAVLGQQPPRVLDRQIRRVLAAGELVSLPEEVLALLLKRRAQATNLGSWVEGHHRPGRRL